MDIGPTFLRPDDPRPVSRTALRQLKADIRAGRVVAPPRDECAVLPAEQPLVEPAAPAEQPLVEPAAPTEQPLVESEPATLSDLIGSDPA